MSEMTAFISMLKRSATPHYSRINTSNSDAPYVVTVGAFGHSECNVKWTTEWMFNKNQELVLIQPPQLLDYQAPFPWKQPDYPINA